MIDKTKTKQLFNAAIDATKAKIANKYQIEQSVLTLREEYAKQNGLIKDGNPDIAKVNKGLFTKALDVSLNVKDNDKMEEDFDQYETFKDVISSKKLTKDSLNSYTQNIELKKETAITLKEVTATIKEDIPEDFQEAFFDLVKLKSLDIDEEYKNKYLEDNGMEIPEKKQKGSSIEVLEELAKILNIDIGGLK